MKMKLIMIRLAVNLLKYPNQVLSTRKLHPNNQHNQ